MSRSGVHDKNFGIRNSPGECRPQTVVAAQTSSSGSNNYALAALARLLGRDAARRQATAPGPALPFDMEIRNDL